MTQASKQQGFIARAAAGTQTVLAHSIADNPVATIMGGIGAALGAALLGPVGAAVLGAVGGSLGATLDNRAGRAETSRGDRPE